MADLVYTGERAIPGLTPRSTMTEHLARYRLAQSQAAHKRVLDACCGSGYGAAMLAEVATEVVAFDLDDASITFAREHYDGDRLRFEVCNIFDWTETDFDLVVCFEALEHVYETSSFLAALHDSLRSTGRVILSTPSYLNCQRSPFHVRCLRRDELEAQMGEWFDGHILGQKGQDIRANVTHPDYWIFCGRSLWAA